jgi:hypothetical protein
MRPFPANLMRMWPISTRVNKPEMTTHQLSSRLSCSPRVGPDYPTPSGLSSRRCAREPSREPQDHFLDTFDCHGRRNITPASELEEPVAGNPGCNCLSAAGDRGWPGRYSIISRSANRGALMSARWRPRASAPGAAVLARRREALLSSFTRALRTNLPRAEAEALGSGRMVVPSTAWGASHES